MGGRYDIMQRIKEVLEASDPLKYGDAGRARSIEVGPPPQLSPDPRLGALAAPPPPPPPATTPPPPPAGVAPGQDELVALLREGRKIAAVKRYRELTDVGLAEAKAAVDALERQLAAGSPPTPGTDALAARVVALLHQGRKIEAIRVYRDTMQVELRAAKEAVEEVEERLRQAAQAPLSAPAPAPPGQPPPQWLAPIVERLRRGDKIGAIKAYRDATGVGLAEAKATVDALERQPGTQGR